MSRWGQATTLEQSLYSFYSSYIAVRDELLSIPIEERSGEFNCACIEMLVRNTIRDSMLTPFTLNLKTFLMDVENIRIKKISDNETA